MFEDNLKERYGLAIDRIAEIKENSEIEDAGLAAYFTYTAEFLLLVDKWNEKRKAGGYDKLPLEELQHWNTVLYEDIIGKQYDNSFANPSYACARLGEDIGRILSFLYTELRGCIVFAAEQRKADFTVLLELFVECYCICKDGENIAAQLKDSIYWYMSDYSDDFIEYRVREQLDPSLDFAVRIIMDSDLTDLRYLYRYGEYITENELRTAAFLNTLSQTEIEQMASTFTEGYRIGFELGNKDISKKKLVNIRYCIGFERLVREEIRQFEQMGLKTTIYRAAQHSINKRMHHKIGYYATSPNKQMDYDHRFDNALYLDAQFTERKLGALRFAYEQHKEAAAVFGGPAVMEVFGENPFEPEDKKEALHLDEKQQKLSVKYDSESSAVVKARKEALQLLHTRCRKSVKMRTNMKKSFMKSCGLIPSTTISIRKSSRPLLMLWIAQNTCMSKDVVIIRRICVCFCRKSPIRRRKRFLKTVLPMSTFRWEKSLPLPF